MRQHCAVCRHGLAMNPNPYATAKEREKAVTAAGGDLERAQADARGGGAAAEGRLQECAEALRLAEAALASAQAAASAVLGELAGLDIAMEEQTDVVLFTSVHDVTRFLCLHPELSK